jgi:hypothetical protein
LNKQNISTMANNHGGAREGAGRKPRAEEEKLIEMLDKHIDQDEVFEVLYGLIKEKNIKAVQIYFDRRFGKPKESVKISSDGFNVNFKDLLSFD